ncbi:MAG: glycosyltransferase [Pseudomonadota bacterium]
MAPINRILIYTPNSIGLGHLFRTAAVVSGLRRRRPHLDILVLTGSSLPQVLLKDGVEVVKLPGIMRDIDSEDQPYRPRLLPGLGLGELLALRKKIIADVHAFFRPDVVMIEHKLAGLLGEASPLLSQKIAIAGKAGEFALVHLSRGNLGRRAIPRLFDIGSGRYDILDLYDFLYILEDASEAEAWRIQGDSSPKLRDKIHFLGRTTTKTKEELPPRREVLERLGLDDRPIVLASLGRHGDIPGIFSRFLAAGETTGLWPSRRPAVILDPYLPEETRNELERLGRPVNATFIPFIHNLVDLINIAELVVCRAGYNTINEIQLTGVRAVVIPERHPSGEQELRAARLSGNITAITEQEVLGGGLTAILPAVLNRAPTPDCHDFNKYEIGRRIIDDLEKWADRR